MFSLDEALTIEEIKAKFEEDTLDEVIKPIDDVFDHTPKVYLRPEAEKYACNGVPLEPHNVDFIQAEDGKCDFHQLTNTLVRVYLQDGTFVGAYEYQNQRLKLRKMFYEK